MWIPLSLLSMGLYIVSELLEKSYLEKGAENAFWKMTTIDGISLFLFSMPFWALGINESGLDPFRLVFTLPLACLPALCTVLVYVFFMLSVQRIPLSIASPIDNSADVVSFVGILVLFLVTGMPLGVTVTPVKIAATAILILASILFLVENRQRLKKTETEQEIIQKKSRRYTAGMCFVFAAAIFDSADTILVSYLAGADTPVGEYDVITAYGFFGLILAVLSFTVITVKQKKLWNPFAFRKEGKGYVGVYICSAADMLAGIAYVLAVGYNPVFAPVLILSYCIFIPVFARIFINEKLTVRQYLIVALAIAGIIMFTVSEAVNGELI